jgi:hypothetical protein
MTGMPVVCPKKGFASMALTNDPAFSRISCSRLPVMTHLILRAYCRVREKARGGHVTIAEALTDWAAEHKDALDGLSPEEREHIENQMKKDRKDAAKVRSGRSRRTAA